ncbi:outer membrane protein assembly factor BamD [Rubripirellula reticaptiva]|uniref:Tetratricopeptide repeat protein n=1 Tax=Rubripirellula reticaptiva TaxID=2528013 RepID=A0A5C6FC81_9BACT|nr:hypothetical protein [Rubripirellula reticaptiva]TWU57181.1 hypothetical protein Poly59_00870 [Rubripirellula reticaptiva]
MIVRFSFGFVFLTLLVVSGCRSSSVGEVAKDTRVRRLADDGRELFAEGDVEAAIKKYQSAVLRAWAMDDPTESGNGAYNLAACMVTDGDNGVARDWLADARAELTRGGESIGNVWLLESRIAIDDGRFAAAARYLDASACATPPCAVGDSTCECPTSEGCKRCPLDCVPCVGRRLEAKRAEEDCRDGFTAQIHLTRARLAAEQFDLAAAGKHFQCACELISDVCSYELHAELQNVAALIHVAKEEYLQAAWHFDREAKYLRMAGNFREVPGALELAAAAYQQAGMPREAADRLNRVARVWVGRGDAKKAWEFVRAASDAVDACAIDDEDSIRIRLSLVARQIERMLKADAYATSH